MLEQGSTLVNATTEEVKESRPRQHVGCVTGSVSIVFFLLIVGHIFLLLCMPGDFCLDARLCEFCLLVAGIFGFLEVLSVLFWDSFKLVGNHVILFDLAFKIGRRNQRSACSKPNYSPC